MYQYLQKRSDKNSLGIFLFLCTLFFFVSFSPAFGATAQYTPLVGIPPLGSAQGTGLAAYLNRIYVVLIALGAIIAFIKIAIAGVKWSMSDVITDKGEAKKDIQGALLGLAILLIPFIVLNTIYPGLTNLNILGGAGAGVNLNTSTGPGGAGGTGSVGTSEPTTPTVNKKIWNCGYTPIPITPPTNEFEAATTEYYYDSSECEKKCAELDGTFVGLHESAGQCTYYEVVTTSTAACATGGPC